MKNVLPPFNPLAPGFNANPYPVYRTYREREPVHWNGAWCLFRYDDVIAALRNPALGREPSRFLPPGRLGDLIGRWMLFRNPPDHTRLRTLVGRAFSGAVVRGLAPRIEAIAKTLIEAFAVRGEVDLIAEYASPLPVLVIAEMLGVPAEDHRRFRDWSKSLSTAVDLNRLSRRSEKTLCDLLEFVDYMRGIVADRRRTPKADLVSGLIAAEEAGDKLTEDELISMCMLLLGAGHETTVNLIGNGMLALLRNPQSLEKLRTDPTRGPAVVEELLRFDSPVQMTFREALEETEVAGQHIRAGQQVCAVLGAANHDPERFPDPDRLDIDRDTERHLAFGFGIHHCLGATLARVEGEVAFRMLLSRLHQCRLESESPQWREGILFHGLESLPVVFDASIGE